jgi:type I restriction enzyme S subunit
MNRIEQLIQQLCPEGVEFKKLGEVCKLERGKSITKKDLIPGKIPVVAGGQTPAYYHNKANRFGETISISSSGAYAGFVNYWTIPVFLSDSFSICPLNKKYLLVKYLFYFLKSKQEQIHDMQKGGGVPHVYPKNVAKILIPIPPLAVQEEIVNILDRFTALEAELEAELEARKKQYEYYRDQLLTFGDDVEWKELGEVAEIQRGASPRPISKFLTNKNDGIPWIKIGDTLPNSKYVFKTKQKITSEGAKKSRILRKGDLIISNSMSFGRPYILNIDGAIHDGWASISNFENILISDFLYYYLTSKSVQFFWNNKINSGSVSNLNANIIKSLPVPIPPLSKQKEIVEILDKFDALVNDISQGLPAEIEARRKQYEYYREKLLTFKARTT